MEFQDASCFLEYPKQCDMIPKGNAAPDGAHVPQAGCRGGTMHRVRFLEDRTASDEAAPSPRESAKIGIIGPAFFNRETS